ncbi:unnamed protein product [Arctia plantaginis]|uniref:Uncharacterized protein n=1 Tax=Arctia plantaginis TaxID=874455 RepID=A0A8S0ZKA9_ARCPL|nr:unnamed protein product [Arctia plantaginis]
MTFRAPLNNTNLDTADAMKAAFRDLTTVDNLVHDPADTLSPKEAVIAISTISRSQLGALTKRVSNMSSKRKSPPSKLQEGAADTEKPEAGPANLDFPDHQESDDNEQHSFYKFSPSSSTRSSISEEETNYEDERPSKKQRFEQTLDMTNNLLVPTSFLSLHQVNDLQARRRGSSECSSPGAEAKVYGRRSKRLTSKMNNSTIKEEKRPTPSTTPVKQNNDRRGVLDAAALQALAGESVLEKERQLSEMILQLQMVREQLLAQQEHAKVGWHSTFN